MNARHWLLLLLVILGLGASFVGGTIYGGQNKMREAAHIYRASLFILEQNEVVNPALSEFMKARFYYCLNRSGQTKLPASVDLGPVSSTAISGLIFGKEPVRAEDEYEDFKRKVSD